MASSLKPVISLFATHETEFFDCGEESLNTWLHNRALQAGRSKSANTYVVVVQNKVIAYYSLAVGEISLNLSTTRLAKGLGKHPIPVIVLARLAVDKNFQGSGLGAVLLQDAIIRALAVSEMAGARAVITHPLNDSAKDFYTNFGFSEGPANYQYLLLKDAKKLLK